MAWESISQAAQAKLLNSIPEKWKINGDKYKTFTDVTSVPRACGILTARQLMITDLTVTDLADRIALRQLKAVEVVEAFAAREAIAHQLVNCLTAWFLEEGLERAKHLDDILERDGTPIGPLHGIPVAIKDTYSLKGIITTRGYVLHKDSVQDHDSTIIQALRDAGAVFFCMTTMPQTGMAMETVSNLWGRTLNPFNTNLGAGGSSGGDAALVAMKGCPIAPSADIGGSIRIPAAFNGLYGIRPTSLRIPKTGWEGIRSGQLSIQDSAGPVCHSVDDMRLFTKVINAHPFNRYDVTSIPIQWRDVCLNEKLAFGIMKWDQVVMPHPPVLRALEQTKQVLTAAGFNVVEFEAPFDCWDLAQTTFDIYFQDGAQDTLSKIKATGEPLIPVVADLFNVYNVKPLSAADVLRLNIKMRDYKTQFAQAWDQTSLVTGTNRPIDALITSPYPAVGLPHNFTAYWGYTSMLNFLDYPSTVLPIKDFQISRERDPANLDYQPLASNPFDKPNHDMYDPDLFSNQLPSIQVVARPFDDEELIEITSVIDKYLNGTGVAHNQLDTN